MKEEWKGVVGHEDYYEVSNLGRLRNAKTKKIRKLFKNQLGYLVCSVSLGSRDNKPTWKIHRLVAKAFIANPENKPSVNHKKGIKTDNRAIELEWVTAKENTQHAVDNGLMKYFHGENHSCSKLNDADIKFIRDNYKPWDKELGARALSKRFNTVHSNIVAIVQGTKWKHSKGYRHERMSATLLTGV